VVVKFVLHNIELAIGHLAQVTGCPHGCGIGTA
jgi:hypothetical protein